MCLDKQIHFLPTLPLPCHPCSQTVSPDVPITCIVTGAEFWILMCRQLHKVTSVRSHHDTAVGNMWPCLSKWVRWILGHFLFEGSSLFIYFLFLGFGSSAKSDCPIFLCIRMMQKCLQMSLKHCLNMHLLVAKDCIAKTLFANFSEWSGGCDL